MHRIHRWMAWEMKIFNEQKICDFSTRISLQMITWTGIVTKQNSMQQQPARHNFSSLYSISAFTRCKWDKRFDRNYFESCFWWIHWAEFWQKIRSGTDKHTGRRGKSTGMNVIVVMKIFLSERLSKLPVFAKIIIVRKVFDASKNVFWKRWNY